MNKVICCPAALLPKSLDPQVDYFVLYPHGLPDPQRIGYIAPSLPAEIRRDGLVPPVRTWDFTCIALSAAAADRAVLRAESEDGWTRMIDLTVCLREPGFWDTKRTETEAILQFLTGDFWKLHFVEDGVEPPVAKEQVQSDADCVCLLSGGVDSLVGGIDLTSNGRKPLFVSQIVRGDRATQRRYATELAAADRHCQWSFSVGYPGIPELSTRGRSLVFFAFAALAASAIPSTKHEQISVVIPENGFISLNVPLGPGRLGSLSTRTTHPMYLKSIQSLWDSAGIPATLTFPYRDRTKGEMLRECTDQSTLIQLIGSSVSCGKYRRHNLTHCGECVPCLVRRAAFLVAGMTDSTEKGYICDQLAHSESRDVSAAAAALLRYRQVGVRRFVGGALSFATPPERTMYENLVGRGLEELGQLLRSHGVV